MSRWKVRLSSSRCFFSEFSRSSMASLSVDPAPTLITSTMILMSLGVVRAFRRLYRSWIHCSLRTHSLRVQSTLNATVNRRTEGTNSKCFAGQLCLRIPSVVTLSFNGFFSGRACSVATDLKFTVD